MHDFVIRKLEDARAVWFAASKSFVLFEEPAFDVFRLYTGNPFSGSKPLKGFPEQERLNRIISFCEKKYGRIEENIPQFVKEIIRLINHFSNPENEITVSAKFPEVTDMTVLQVEEVVNYQIGFKNIPVGYQNRRLKEIIHPAIAHLETKNKNAATHLIGVYENHDILFFTYGGKIADAFKKENEHYFTGCIRQLMFGILYNREYAGWMMALHASAVAGNKEAVVFSAAGGSGKSTLSALLKAHGYIFLTDDFIAADQNRKVYPFPAAISVKQGSLKTLSEYYPGLNEISTQETRIGKAVRYLPVENLTGDYESGFPVKAFVFVKYGNRLKPLLEEVNRKKALQLLLEETWVKPEPENVEKFFDWIENTRFYRMQYAETAQALDFVHQIFSV